jgi:hypothetical protein
VQARPHAELTSDQFFELIISPGGHPSKFASDAERRRAWKAHRSRILARGTFEAGRRPWAFWVYDFPGGKDPCSSWAEPALLIQAGMVDADERDRIHQQWRHFDHVAWSRSCGNYQRYLAERDAYGIPSYFELRPMSVTGATTVS